MKRALVTIAACVLAFFAARLTVDQPAPVAPPARVREVVVQQAAAPQRAVGPGELRTIVREELREAAPVGEPAPPAAPSPHATRAHALVDGAIANRAWTDRDRDELRRMLVGMSPEETDAVLSKLVLATNAGTLAIESVPL